MKSRVFFFLLGMMLLQVDVQAQEAVRGTVRDAAERPVAGARVHLLNTLHETVTDLTGSFLLNGIASGRHTLEVSAAGFSTQLVEWMPGRTSELRVILSAASARLDGVVVTAQKREERLQQVPISITALNARAIEAYRLWDIREL